MSYLGRSKDGPMISEDLPISVCACAVSHCKICEVKYHVAGVSKD